MIPVEAFSQLQSKRLTPKEAWDLGCRHVIENVEWGYVLQLALYRDSSCQEDWARIFKHTVDDEQGKPNIPNIRKAFKKSIAYLKRESPKNQFVFLSIWAFQRETPENCRIRNFFEKLNAEALIKWDVINAIEDPNMESRANELAMLQHYAQLTFSNSTLKMEETISVNPEYWSIL